MLRRLITQRRLSRRDDIAAAAWLAVPWLALAAAAAAAQPAPQADEPPAARDSPAAAPVQATARSSPQAIEPAALPEAPAAALLADAPEPGPSFALPTTLDRAGRVLVAVDINGTGPYRFVLDTGANRSAVSQQLVDALGLESKTAQLMQVHGTTGTAVLAAVDVEDFRVGDFRLRGLQLPVLEPNVLAGADGILGVTELNRARIEIDFVKDSVEVHQSSRRSTPPGWVTIPVRLKFRGLLVAPMRIGRVRAMAIIDTGAERSMGNLALLSALLARSVRDVDARTSTVIGVTSQLGEVVTVRIPSMVIVGARLTDMEVLFGDLYVFDVWGLKSEPALVIGMDLLGTIERLIIDYGRRQIQMKP